MIWQELKWPEIRALSKDSTAVIPLGSVEQHGLHLPLCTDTTQVTSIARAVESRLSNEVVLLPTLWLGSSHHHLDFPGTLSLRPSLYTQVLQELAMSVLNAGFRRLFFLNGHGGNETPAAQALTELAVTDAKAGESLLAMSSWWSVGKPDPERLGMQSPTISHACEYETSLMLLLRPDLVELNLATNRASLREESWLGGSKPISMFRRFATMTATGSLGAPVTATAAKGEALYTDVVEDIVAFLTDFVHWPLPTILGPTEPRS